MMMKFSILICSILLGSVESQELKFKKDTSCSTKMASKLRRHSILIASKISGNQANIATLRDCFTGCSNHANCEMFAHHEKEKRCMFFKEILVNEVLSRLIFEGWSPGKINAQEKIISYISDTCSEEYCRDSCLSGVRETCTPSLYRLPECTAYDGVFTGCDHARKILQQNPSMGLSLSSASFDQTIRISIGGGSVYVPCQEHVEYTQIVAGDGKCMADDKDNWYGFYRRNCYGGYGTTYAYNRITHVLKPLYRSWQFFKMASHNYYYRWDVSQHLMPTEDEAEKETFKRTGFGTYQISDGRYMMRELHVHMLNYFYQELSSPPFASSTLSHEYNNFTNIPGAVKVSLYEGFIGNLDTLHAQTPSRIGRYDNFESFNFDRLLENYGMILQTYFVPPSDGLYRFILVSDDDAKLFISLNDQESDKFEIVHNLIAIGTTDYSRQSSAIQLQANQKYYMEIIGREIHYDDYFIAGVILPNGDQIVPITYQYLEHYY
ncbi:uncharacterized protein [Clytia hemisphaerica]